MSFSADLVEFYFLQILVRKLCSQSPKRFWDSSPGRHLPRGLMVLSSVSLSLLDFPLDIRAAMENALARDESCGFGDDVYSMSGGWEGDQTKIFHWRTYRNPLEAPTGGPPAEGNQQICPQSQMKPCGSLLGRMSGRSDSRGCSASCGLWSEDLLLFGELQPSSYNSWSPPIRAFAPTSRSHCPGAALVPSNQWEESSAVTQARVRARVRPFEFKH